MESGLSTHEEPRVLNGRYTLADRLGAGASGVVYRACDRRLGEDVAIKFIHSFLNRDRNVMHRLKEEVLISRRLRNPHAVEIYDFGYAQDGTPFVVMELVAGITLRKRLLDNEHFPEASVLQILVQLLTALAAAHEKGIAHLDVKPENILFDGDGVLKLADFGLAKFSELEYNRSQTQETLGSPVYISPEQLRGHPADGRSDLYAAGIITYELFHGTPPFSGETFFDLARKHLYQPADLELMQQQYNAPWAKPFLERALSKEPADRFENAGHALDFLMQFSPVAAQNSETVLSWKKNRRTRSRKNRVARWKRALRIDAAGLALFLLFTVAISHIHPRGAWTAADLLLKLERATGKSLTPLKTLYGLQVQLSRPEDLFKYISGYRELRERYLAMALIDNGVDVTIRNENGDTPLHYALKIEAKDVINSLAERKEALTLRDKAGLTPFEIAVERGFHNYTQLLMQDVVLEKMDAQGGTPLHIAVRHGSWAMSEYALSTPAKEQALRARDDHGNTPLHLIMEASTPWIAPIMNLILRLEADPDAKNTAGDTPLLIGVRGAATDRVSMLLKTAPYTDVTIRDAHNQTPLMIAVANGDVEIVRLLLDRDPLLKRDILYRATVGTLQSRKRTGEIALLLRSKMAELNGRN